MSSGTPASRRAPSLSAARLTMAMMCAGSKGAKKISPQRERMAGLISSGALVLDVGGDLRVFFVVVGGVEADALIFEDLQQLV